MWVNIKQRLVNVFVSMRVWKAHGSPFYDDKAVFMTLTIFPSVSVFAKTIPRHFVCAWFIDIVVTGKFKTFYCQHLWHNLNWWKYWWVLYIPGLCLFERAGMVHCSNRFERYRAGVADVDTTYKFLGVNRWSKTRKCVRIMMIFMMTSWNGNIFGVTVGNSLVTQRPVTRSCNVFFDLLLNKRLCKQSRRRWFVTPSRPLWRHCNISINQTMKRQRAKCPSYLNLVKLLP